MLSTWPTSVVLDNTASTFQPEHIIVSYENTFVCIANRYHVYSISWQIQPIQVYYLQPEQTSEWGLFTNWSILATSAEVITYYLHYSLTSYIPPYHFMTDMHCISLSCWSYSKWISPTFPQFSLSGSDNLWYLGRLSLSPFPLISLEWRQQSSIIMPP